jgi:predicted DNA-binding ribbon-helix-helix protein
LPPAQPKAGIRQAGLRDAVTAVEKRSVTIRGHRTSFSLEKPFFDELAAIAAVRAMPLAALVAEIDENRRRQTNLSSAIRLYVLAWIKASAKSSIAP